MENSKKNVEVASTKSKKVKTSGLAIAALVLGIIGLVLSFIPIINNVAFVLGVVGVILGTIGIVKSRKKAMGIVAVILCVASMGLTIFAQQALVDSLNDSLDEYNESVDNMSGKNTDELLGTSVDVQLGAFTASVGEYGLVDSALPVTVTNLTDESASFQVSVEAVDAEGNRIDTGYIYANSLGAGQSYSEDLFTYFSSEELEKYQNATYKILEVSMY